jgi:signal transduction histidine kinase
VEYLNMAGAIQVNATELARDESLAEPLSRMWNTPRYFLIPPQLQRAGKNVVLIRVSGLAAYSPGLGPVRIGPPEEMRDVSGRELAVRHDWQIATMAVIGSLSLFFFVLWLFRRKETAYGWYSAQQFAWLNGNWNIIATSAWPFATTDAFELANTATFILFCGCYTMFVLRFCNQRWRRFETIMWVVIVVGCISLFLTPHAYVGQMRGWFTFALTAYSILPNFLLVYFGLRSARVDLYILSAVGLINLIALCHDTMVFTGLLESNIYYSQYSALAVAAGAALVLAWNFARNLRRAEDFNVELQRSVDGARAELAKTLDRQHQLELAHTSIRERVNLAYELHDGLGGMLVGNIAALEQAPDQVPSRDALNMLRELREDLRLIIDTASVQQQGQASLAKLLAPLRKRMTLLLEAQGIQVRWSIGDLDRANLTPTQSMDLLRILQEGLTNIFKHSGANRAHIHLFDNDEALLLEISDNGAGIDASGEKGLGVGIQSMTARAKRLNGALSIDSRAQGTVVRLQVPHTKSGQDE